MTHRLDMLKMEDARLEALLSRQILQEGDPRFGGFWTDEFHVEPRHSGFNLGAMVAAFVTKESKWYLDAKMEMGIRAVLCYMQKHQRPDGCFDLSYCNFASPPDTAFMVNAMLNGWWLLEKCTDAAADFIRKPMYDLIDRCASGIAGGGFHTPNHRWAIASCLLNIEKITGRKELGERARVYLAEGLDINEDGEFAERSAGNYNQVNDDQMIRLYLATGEKRFLEAARQNLQMMYCYFDPDNSVFTNNSTRQDLGRKVYADTYYILYLLVGWLLKDESLGAMAEWIYQDCMKRGACPPGIEWLLLFPEMDGYGAKANFVPPVDDCSRLFPDSCIARIRRGKWSVSLLQGKPNFLYFQHGSFSMYMNIYGNLCDRRNFLSDTLEKTETGYRMQSHAAGWYYLPFDTPPATSDWWQMDNPNTRKKIEGLPLDTTVEIVEKEDGIDLHLKTEGIDQLPLRLECAFLPGGYVRTKHFIQTAKAGESICILDGEVEAAGPNGEKILIGPAFGAHHVTERMGGAYPLSDRHYTCYFTGYTPVEQIISIRAGGMDPHP